MELKCLKTMNQLNPKEFQSYLYGIEMSAYCEFYKDAHVSIVPLWNWNCIRCVELIFSWKFQSYLYGIEIRWTEAKCLMALTRFNRTFMELKLRLLLPCGAVCLVSIVPLWNWNMDLLVSLKCLILFQSYLYGIEIMFLLKAFCSFCVSIVPLWNWNWCRGDRGRHSLWLFQSYLYGIEIKGGCTEVYRAARFNRTFMELK